LFSIYFQVGGKKTTTHKTAWNSSAEARYSKTAYRLLEYDQGKFKWPIGCWSKENSVENKRNLMLA
jgi:hypothetical protein